MNKNRERNKWKENGGKGKRMEGGKENGGRGKRMERKRLREEDGTDEGKE